jgi:hypothetical protein
MTTMTTTKIPGNPSLHPNCTAASCRRTPARAAPTIPWTGVLLTRQIACDAPPAGPRLCRRPCGRRPVNSNDAFKGTARQCRCRRCCCCRCHCCQPPPKDAAVLLLFPPHHCCRPSSSSTSPPRHKVGGKAAVWNFNNESTGPIHLHAPNQSQSVRGGLVRNKLFKKNWLMEVLFACQKY